MALPNSETPTQAPMVCRVKVARQFDRESPRASAVATHGLVINDEKVVRFEQFADAKLFSEAVGK